MSGLYCWSVCPSFFFLNPVFNTDIKIFTQPIYRCTWLTIFPVELDFIWRYCTHTHTHVLFILFLFTFEPYAFWKNEAGSTATFFTCLHISIHPVTLTHTAWLDLRRISLHLRMHHSPNTCITHGSYCADYLPWSRSLKSSSKQHSRGINNS